MTTESVEVELRLQYFEIEDRDFTAVEIEVRQAGKRVARFRNWDFAAETKEVWGNQCEVFRLPSLKAALDFIASAGCYERVAR